MYRGKGDLYLIYKKKLRTKKPLFNYVAITNKIKCLLHGLLLFHIDLEISFTATELIKIH